MHRPVLGSHITRQESCCSPAPSPRRSLAKPPICYQELRSVVPWSSISHLPVYQPASPIPAIHVHVTQIGISQVGRLAQKVHPRFQVLGAARVAVSLLLLNLYPNFSSQTVQASTEQGACRPRRVHRLTPGNQYLPNPSFRAAISRQQQPGWSCRPNLRQESPKFLLMKKGREARTC